MENVDIILTNAIVLTMDEQMHQYEPGAVAVRGDCILAVGPEADILAKFASAEKIDCEGRLLMPGLVNAHTHVPMTLLRGLADDLRLDVWLQGYMMPVEREFVSPDFVRLGTKLACAEMIRSGVTCFADMYYFEDDIADATAEAGMRAVCSQSIMKFPTPDAQSYEESLAYCRDFIQRWKGHPLIVPSIAPHAVYTCTPEILHVGAGVAHNPSSNLKLASGIAPVKKMLDQGLNVGIGTDGPASNNDLDMFEEVRLAAFLAKGSSGDPTALPAQTALLMATRMGAQAMHIGDITGSLEPGKRADLILIDLDPLHNSPRFRRHPQGTYAQVVYASKSTDVSDVMINGKWVMRNRELLTLDEKALVTASRDYAQRIDAFLIQREQSVLSKLIAIGGATEEESFEVQVKVRIDNPDTFVQAVEAAPVEIVRRRHYRQYDTYFCFTDPEQGMLRYREDTFVGDQNEITGVRSRLTLIGVAIERSYPKKVLLSRSRFLAPATQSLRFYREYFKPIYELEVEKERRRFLVRYKETEFFINVDQVQKPDGLGAFLEIKSRTWSRADADLKSKLVAELIVLLGASLSDARSEDYVDMVRQVNK